MLRPGRAIRQDVALWPLFVQGRARMPASPLDVGQGTHPARVAATGPYTSRLRSCD